MTLFWKMLLLCSFAILSHNVVFARPAAKMFPAELMSWTSKNAKQGPSIKSMKPVETYEVSNPIPATMIDEYMMSNDPISTVDEANTNSWIMYSVVDGGKEVYSNDDDLGGSTDWVHYISEASENGDGDFANVANSEVSADKTKGHKVKENHSEQDDEHSELGTVPWEAFLGEGVDALYKIQMPAGLSKEISAEAFEASDALEVLEVFKASKSLESSEEFKVLKSSESLESQSFEALEVLEPFKEFETLNAFETSEASDKFKALDMLEVFDGLAPVSDWLVPVLDMLPLDELSSPVLDGLAPVIDMLPLDGLSSPVLDGLAPVLDMLPLGGLSPVLEGLPLNGLGVLDGLAPGNMFDMLNEAMGLNLADTMGILMPDGMNMIRCLSVEVCPLQGCLGFNVTIKAEVVGFVGCHIYILADIYIQKTLTGYEFVFDSCECVFDGIELTGFAAILQVVVETAKGVGCVIVEVWVTAVNTCMALGNAATAIVPDGMFDAFIGLCLYTKKSRTEQITESPEYENNQIEVQQVPDYVQYSGEYYELNEEPDVFKPEYGYGTREDWDEQQTYPGSDDTDGVSDQIEESGNEDPTQDVSATEVIESILAELQSGDEEDLGQYVSDETTSGNNEEPEPSIDLYEPSGSDFEGDKDMIPEVSSDQIYYYVGEFGSEEKVTGGTLPMSEGDSNMLEQEQNEWEEGMVSQQSEGTYLKEIVSELPMEFFNGD